jgi:hypothetical protein
MIIVVSDSYLTILATYTYNKSCRTDDIDLLIDAAVEYSIARRLKVIANCPSIHLQLSAGGEKYDEIWSRSGIRDGSPAATG